MEVIEKKDYLRMLAHWFVEMDRMGRFAGTDTSGDEVSCYLLKIAEKLELQEKIIDELHRKDTDTRD